MYKRWSIKNMPCDSIARLKQVQEASEGNLTLGFLLGSAVDCWYDQLQEADSVDDEDDVNVALTGHS